MCSEWGAPRTRAPHLLLIPSTGRYSVRLNRFMNLHSHRCANNKALQHKIQINLHFFHKSLFIPKNESVTSTSYPKGTLRTYIRTVVRITTFFDKKNTFASKDIFLSKKVVYSKILL